MTDDAAMIEAPSTRNRAIDVLYIVTCCISLFYALSVYVPLVQRDPETQWLGWMYALNIAHIKGLAFGRDVMFTYGPLGFAWIGYHPATFALLVAFWTVV